MGILRLSKSGKYVIQVIRTQEGLDKIRDELKSNVGKRVDVRAKKGRRRIGINGAYIEDAYPSVFTIVVMKEGKIVQRHSYTYSDILTKNVELKVL